MIAKLKEKLARLLAKTVLRLMGHPQGMVIMQDAFFPDKFLAITVLDTAEDLEAFRLEQEWLDEITMEARAGKKQLVQAAPDDEEDELDDDINELMNSGNVKKTMLQ